MTEREHFTEVEPIYGPAKYVRYNDLFYDLDRSPGVAKKDNSVSSSLEKMIVYVSQRKKNLENVSHGLNQIPENHM